MSIMTFTSAFFFFKKNFNILIIVKIIEEFVDERLSKIVEKFGVIRCRWKVGTVPLLELGSTRS